jgi:hypothetical protein
MALRSYRHGRDLDRDVVMVGSATVAHELMARLVVFSLSASRGGPLDLELASAERAGAAVLLAHRRA